MARNRIESILDQVRGRRVLDVSCAGEAVEPDSDNWLHRHLVDRFPDVVGIDLSERKVKEMRELGFANIYAGNAEKFALEKRFDTIVAGELLEHLSNPGRFLECCREHLAPGGRVVLTTPYPFSLLYFL